jgi:hypothetical protein
MKMLPLIKSVNSQILENKSRSEDSEYENYNIIYEERSEDEASLSQSI